MNARDVADAVATLMSELGNGSPDPASAAEGRRPTTNDVPSKHSPRGDCFSFVHRPIQ